MGSCLAVASDPFPVPHGVAPVVPDYPQFRSIAVPENTSAVQAWLGEIRPFQSDDSARRFLRCAEAERPFNVIEGTIEASTTLYPNHWADPWLVDTGLTFKIMVLEFAPPAHPQAFAIQPLISRAIHPLYPHLREDKKIQVYGTSVPALCIYSGAEFHYAAEWPILVQFLDQVAAFLGRHIIWLRTRIGIPKHFGERFRVPAPGELTVEGILSPIDNPGITHQSNKPSKWIGYWPGPSAPTGPDRHLETIRATDQCWCWSGKKYGDCHRPIEKKWVRR